MARDPKMECRLTNGWNCDINVRLPNGVREGKEQTSVTLENGVWAANFKLNTT